MHHRSNSLVFNRRSHVLSLVLSFLIATSGCAIDDSGGGAATDTKSMTNRLVVRFFQIIPETARNPSDPSENLEFSQQLSMVGREDLVRDLETGRDYALECDETREFETELFAEILERASETTVVMINEAHDKPHHRDFIQKVAGQLWPLGYRVYAAETFSPFIGQSMAVEYTRVNDGYYSNEPVFGDLIRNTKAIGYRLASYEYSFPENHAALSRNDQAIHREEGQANNLVDIVDGLAANERLLVHAGYSHASEVPLRGFADGDIDWMAVRFKKKTGIDPFTIDQTKCASNDRSITMFKDAGRVRPGQFDLQIGHPVIEFDRRRPRWRQARGDRLIDVPESLRETNGRVIIEVRPVSEPPEAVPVDRLMLWPGEEIPLLLAPGVYNLIGYHENTGNHHVVQDFEVD